jgi:hypothetical protein
MLPMVPSQRQNMIAWLAAHCDPPELRQADRLRIPQGQAYLWAIPSRSTDQPEYRHSQQLSLWNQRGSRVIRSNILVIPIENSILYVSPLYLRAEQGQLPELKRVIAAYGDHVVMKHTLAEALAALFTKAGPTASGSAAAGTPPPSDGGLGARRARSLQSGGRALEIRRLGRLRRGDSMPCAPSWRRPVVDQMPIENYNEARMPFVTGSSPFEAARRFCEAFWASGESQMSHLRPAQREIEEIEFSQGRQLGTLFNSSSRCPSARISPFRPSGAKTSRGTRSSCRPRHRSAA